MCERKIYLNLDDKEAISLAIAEPKLLLPQRHAGQMLLLYA